MKSQKSGFTIMEIIIVVVVLVVVGLLGYVAYTRFFAPDANNTSQQESLNEQNSDGSTADAPEINSTEDLDSAAAALDKADLDTTSDSNTLQSDLGSF